MSDVGADRRRHVRRQRHRSTDARVRVHGRCTTHSNLGHFRCRELRAIFCFPGIFEHEVKRRLPQALVRSFSPLGYLHPLPLDGGFVAEPLGEWTTERAAALARDLDFVAIGGGEIIHDHDAYYGAWYDVDASEAERLRPSRFFIEGLGEEAEHTTPVAWHSVGIPFDLDGGDR